MDTASGGNGGGFPPHSHGRALQADREQAARGAGGDVRGGGCCGGGGIANNIGTLNLTNTIVAGNTIPISPDINGTVTTTGHNLIGDTSGSSGITGGMNGDIVNSTSLLAALGNYGGAIQTVALLPGSPAIDAGADNVCASIGLSGVNNKDQRE